MARADRRERRGGARCPICGRAAAPASRPFCSRTCADADLGRWLGGGYAIPGPPVAPDDRAGDRDPEAEGGEEDPEAGAG
jgi:hypothetical protein